MSIPLGALLLLYGSLSFRTPYDPLAKLTDYELKGGVQTTLLDASILYERENDLAYRGVDILYKPQPGISGGWYLKEAKGFNRQFLSADYRVIGDWRAGGTYDMQEWGSGRILAQIAHRDDYGYISLQSNFNDRSVIAIKRSVKAMEVKDFYCNILIVYNYIYSMGVAKNFAQLKMEIGICFKPMGE